MPSEEPRIVFDFRLLHQASATLLGYFVHTWYTHYLGVITANLKRLYDNRLIDGFEPTERGTYSILFDFSALNMEKISYINGIYFYILSCHKAANYCLMNRYDGKQVMYLRGFDYEAAVTTGGNMAVGFFSLDTTLFNHMLGQQLSPHFRVFKALSPKDVYWETVDAQRYFHGDFVDMIRLAKYPFSSVYLNARHWQDDIAHLLDRMDHYVVYISSITESVLWELEQLDTDDRRGRVTVVFDEKAIANKDLQLGVQHRMQDEYGDKLIWSKLSPASAQTVADLREQLAAKFLLTTPEAFEQDIEQHRERIAASSAQLAPGARETHLAFRFYPALDAEALAELVDLSAAVQARITARVGEQGITCLPLFLNDVQLRIYMTLLMGEHHETGRALAAYAAVMQSALDYYSQPGEKVGDLSEEGRERHLEMLTDHYEMAHHIALRMLAYGKSHEFDDFSAVATADYAAAFAATQTAVAEFFSVVTARHAT
jgi:hypothetical protein